MMTSSLRIATSLVGVTTVVALGVLACSSQSTGGLQPGTSVGGSSIGAGGTTGSTNNVALGGAPNSSSNGTASGGTAQGGSNGNGGGGANPSSGGVENRGGSASSGGAVSSSGGTATSGNAGGLNRGGSSNTTGGTLPTNNGGNAGRGGSSSTSAGTSTTGAGGSTSRGGTANSGGTSPSVGGTSSSVPTGLPASCSGNCNAATPADPKTTAYGTLGNVTVYSTSASNGGACIYGATSVMYYAAIDTSLEWQGGHICGQCLEVTLLTSKGPKSVVVRVMDKCPDGNCGVDLGGSAPAVVMADGSGRYQGAWRAVSCVGQTGVSDAAPSLFVKDGASAGWSIIQIRNGNGAVTGIDWQNTSDSTKKGSLTWATEAENHISIPTSILSANASFLFTVHYSDGSTGTVTLTSSQLSKASTGYPLD